MLPRERVFAALEHREPDRIPWGEHSIDYNVYEDILGSNAGFFELKTALEGGKALPVQPDGGLKCFGHPIGASGLRMLYEMYLQLQGKAGPRQIKDPKLGLTHNMGGAPPGCCIAVNILGL